MREAARPFLVLICVAAICALAAYGLYSASAPPQGERYQEAHDQAEESARALGGADSELVRLARRLREGSYNPVLQNTGTWISSWLGTEPVGATIVLVFCALALVCFLALPVIAWQAIRRLKEIAENQRAVAKLLNLQLYQSRKREQNKIAQSQDPASVDK